MLGYPVDKGILDMKVGKAVIELRAAFYDIQLIQSWLASNPVQNPGDSQVDPLTQQPFDYTADEAYAMRLYFSTFDAVRTDNDATFTIGAKMSGLS